MREIKVRVWDKEAGKMIYSDQQYDNYFFEFKDGKLCAFVILETAEGNLHEPPEPYCEELDDLMQYTGLKDKNGKEIYEGDIIKTMFFPEWVERVSWKGEPDATVKVIWDFTGFRLETISNKDHRYPGMCEMNLGRTEIIGNIYENPELLK